jgi:ubiquinone/menaquinone biosynthesis C-methylase UbiE
VSEASPATPSAQPGEGQRLRALEREWQNTVGYALLDKPHEVPGAEAVFFKQWDRLIELLDQAKAGPLLEIGCGKGHFLHRLREVSCVTRPLVGVDISRAVYSLPAQGFAGAQADGESMPFRSGCAACVILTGSLHHMIDYVGALRESIRVLEPGGTLIVFEPTISFFSQLAHRLLDPIVFRKVVYESPIDIECKKDFQFEKIIEVLRQSDMRFEIHRSDFLAYPFTGCYAGSVFSRSERFMRLLMAIEDRIEAIPILRSLALVFSWRVTIVAKKGPS